MTLFFTSVGSILCILLSLYFFFRAHINGFKHFGVLMLVFSYIITFGYLYESEIILEFPHIARTGFPITALIGPLLFLGIKGFLEKRHKFSVKEYLSFIYFFGIVLYLTPFFFESVVFKYHYLKQDLIEVHFDCYVLNSIVFLGNSILLVISFIEITKVMKENHSFKHSTLNIIRAILFAFLCGFLFFTIATSIDVQLLNSGIFIPFMTVIIFLLIIVLLKSQSSLIGNELSEKQKYKGNELSDDFILKKGKEIISVIKNEQLFLSDEFRLRDIAKRFSMTSQNISQIINRYTDKSFSQIVTKFRVEEFQKRMSEDKSKQFSILEVALECGFSSKSSFYNAFKNETGMTPSEWLNTPK